MATVNDIVNGALLKIGVRALNEPADADEAATALDTYNGAMSELALAGWIESFTAQALIDTVPLAEGYTEGLKAHVAVRVAPTFERPVQPQLRSEATLFMSHIANAKWAEATQRAEMERGLWQPRPGDFY